MKLLYSPGFWRQYHGAPLQVQKAFDKQAKFLVQDLRHPNSRGQRGISLPRNRATVVFKCPHIHQCLYFWEYPRHLA